MSHREKSLTPWLTSTVAQRARDDLPPAHWDGTRWSDDDPKTDQEKHNYCLRRTGAHATFLPPAMYDRAEAQGCDMRMFVKNKPIDYTVTEARIVAHLQYAGAVSGPRFNPISPTGLTRRGNPVRKHVGEKQCGGKDTPCLPGKSGNCVACCDED